MLSRLYELYSREIYLYLYSMCRNSGQAEDMMQECFLRAILSLNDDHGNMRAWLYRVARNLLTDQLRSRRNGVSLDELTETPSDAPGPLALYLRTEKHRVLMEKLASLEPRRREVLSLRARRGLKQKLEEDGYDFS